MQSAKEKISNMASAGKEHVEIYKAKVEEKLEKAAARREEEKKIAEERGKAKEAEAKKELHEAKARHAAEKLSQEGPAAAPVYGQNEPVVGTQSLPHHQQLVGTANPMAGATAPTYPLGTQLHHNRLL